MGQLVGCIRGIGEACRALDFPVVSGNVSLYNETNGRGILPTPTIGGVGVLDDCAQACDRRLQARGRRDPARRRDPAAGSASRSICARSCGREEGAPPPVDLEAERRNGDFVRHLIRGAACRHGPRLLRRRRSRSRSPRWRWPAASARSCPNARSTCPAMPICSARTRAATSSRSIRDTAPDILYSAASKGIPVAHHRHDRRPIR